MATVSGLMSLGNRSSALYSGDGAVLKNDVLLLALPFLGVDSPLDVLEAFPPPPLTRRWWGVRCGIPAGKNPHWSSWLGTC